MINVINPLTKKGKKMSWWQTEEEMVNDTLMVTDTDPVDVWGGILDPADAFEPGRRWDYDNENSWRQRLWT